MTNIIVTEKYCPHCQTIKPIAEFSRSRGQSGGYCAYCRFCTAQKYAERVKTPEGREARRAYTCDYRKRNLEYKRKKDRENKASPQGLKTARRLYWRDPEKHREKNRIYRNSDKGRAVRKAYNKRVYADPERRRIMRDKRFQKKFGITVEQYDRQFAAQGGVCAIYLRPPNKILLHVDHDHQTGAFRGLLCFPCNVVLGAWNDSPEAADRAGAYLRKHRQLKLVV